MSYDRKRPLWPWIMALLIGLPVLYVASFGPLCWWIARKELNPGTAPRTRVVPSAYWPIGYAAINSPRFLWKPVNWYATALTDDQLYLALPISGNATIFMRED